MMGIIIAIMLGCLVGIVIASIKDEEGVMWLLIGIGISCVAIIITMEVIASQCDDYGKFNFANKFYQCELIQGKK